MTWSLRVSPGIRYVRVRIWLSARQKSGRANFAIVGAIIIFCSPNHYTPKFYFRLSDIASSSCIRQRLGTSIPCFLQRFEPLIGLKSDTLVRQRRARSLAVSGFRKRRRASGDWHSTWRQNQRRFAPLVLPQVLRQRVCWECVKQKRHVEWGAKVIKGL